MAKYQATREEGIAEVDETFLLELLKRLRGLPGTTRQPGDRERIRGPGRFTSHYMVEQDYAGFQSEQMNAEAIGNVMPLSSSEAGCLVMGWRRILEHYGKEVNINVCLHEVLGHPMQHVT